MKMKIILVFVNLTASAVITAAQEIPVEYYRRATSWDSYSGVKFTTTQIDYAGNAGTMVQSIDGGDWIGYHDIDFADGIYDMLILAIGRTGGMPEGQIEIRLDSRDGQLLKSFTPPVSHSFFHFSDKDDTTMLNGITGVHDIFLVFKGGKEFCVLEEFILKGSISANSAAAKTYYVALYGNDANDGLSVEKPFRTIQKAAMVMRPGSVCKIRGGIYREKVKPTFTGTAALPLRFEPYNNEDVVVSAAEKLTGWTKHEGNIYRAPMDWDLGKGINQLYIDGKALLAARTPNAGTKIGEWNEDYAGMAGDGSGKDMFNVALKYLGWGCPGPEADKPIGGTSVGFGSGPVTSQFDRPDGHFDGALFAANGSWIATRGEVIKSRRESDKMGFEIFFWTCGGMYGYGYFSGTLALLDTANEYAYKDNAIYAWLPESDSPDGHLLEAKKRQVVFDLRGKSYVTLKNLKIFAGSVTMGNADHCVLDGIQARHISHFFLWEFANYTDFGWPGKDASSGFNGFYVSGSDNSIRNSTIAHSAGSGIIAHGENILIENCYIHHCNYVASYDAAVTVPGGANTVRVEHCDMHTLGRGAIDNFALKAMYNRMHNFMIYSGEGGAIYTSTPQQDYIGKEVAYNWIYNPVKGLTGGLVTDNFITAMLRIHHNVFYNNKTMIACNMCVDPHVNQIYNNTIIDTAEWEDPPYGVNNIFHYVEGADHWKLTDIENMNFMPQKGSAAIDAATADIPQTFHYGEGGGQGNPVFDQSKPAIPAVTLTDYSGSAPDLGAYETGKEYWVPGPDYPEPEWVYPPKEIKSSAVALMPAQSMDGTMPLRLTIQANSAVIHAPANAQLRIFSLNGRLIKNMSWERTGIYRVSLSTFPAGIYLARLQSGRQIKVHQIMMR